MGGERTTDKFDCMYKSDDRWVVRAAVRELKRWPKAWEKIQQTHATIGLAPPDEAKEKARWVAGKRKSVAQFLAWWMRSEDEN